MLYQYAMRIHHYQRYHQYDHIIWRGGHTRARPWRHRHSASSSLLTHVSRPHGPLTCVARTARSAKTKQTYSTILRDRSVPSDATVNSFRFYRRDIKDFVVRATASAAPRRGPRGVPRVRGPALGRRAVRCERVIAPFNWYAILVQLRRQTDDGSGAPVPASRRQRRATRW